MNMKRCIKPSHLFFLILAFLLAGCIPADFTYPLPGHDSSKIDKRLIGVWVKKSFDAAGVENYENEFIHFFPVNDNDLEMVIIKHNEKASVRAEVLCIRLNNDNYMNLRHKYYKYEDGRYDLSKTTKSKYFWLAKYKLRGDDKLSIWYVDMKSAQKLIEEGKVKGTTIKDSESDIKHVIVDSDSESLSKLIDNIDHKELFSAYGYYEKLDFD